MVGSSQRALSVRSTVYVFGQVLSKGLSFLLVPLFTRQLTQGEYGLLAICTAVMAGLQPLLSLGLPSALARFFALAADDRERRRLVGSLSWATGALVLAGGITVEAVTLAIGRGELFGIPWNPALRLAVWGALLATAAALPVALVQMEERTAAYALLTYGQPVLRLLVSVVFVALLHRGLLGVLESIALSYILFLPVYAWILVRGGTARLDWEILTRCLVFGLPLVPHNIAHWILNLSDRLVIQPFVTAADLGLYALAFQVAQIVLLGGISINDALMPFLLNRASDPQAPAIFSQVSRLFAFGIGALTVVVVASAGPLVGLLAPPAYAPAARLVAPMAAGYLFLALYYVPRHFLFLAGRSGVIALCSAAAAAVNILWNLLVTPRLGIGAAAWGTCVSYLLLWAAVTVLARDNMIGRLERRDLVAVLGGVMSAVAVATFLVPRSLGLAFLFPLLAGGGVGIALVVAGRRLVPAES